MAGSKEWVYQNLPDEGAHVIGPQSTITAKVPGLCVLYTNSGRSFSKNQVQNFVPMKGVCQT